ncbi:MAG TPA: hypothetical protein VM536_02765, partial [Chloroflexia bacterium]|nr:hypothetical protein [Chloroflexia bacterium]
MADRPGPGEIPAWLWGARLAPSAHNTQPWRFTPLHDGTIAVAWDAARALPAGDPSGRDLLLSLGAAVESAILASGAAGLPLCWSPSPDDSPNPAYAARDGAVVGRLVPTPVPLEGHLVRLAGHIAGRRTSRLPHKPGPLPDGVASRLRDEARAGGCDLLTVTHPGALRRLGRLAGAATAWGFADQAIHDELCRWLRLDPRDPAYGRDGLTAACLDLRGPARLAARILLRPGTMRVLVRLGLHHALSAGTGTLVHHATAMCLLTAALGTSRAGLVTAGRTLFRVWLEAAGAGLTTHPVSALIDCPATIGPTLRLYGAPGMEAV